MINLSKENKNIFLIIRFRNSKWFNLPYFADLIKKLRENENILLADDYSQLHNSYKYCSYADLIIANFTALADECLSRGKKLIFYDYTHNLESIVSQIPGYLPEVFFPKNYNQLMEKVSLNLRESSNENTNFANKFYSVKNKELINEKMQQYLEEIYEEN